MSNTFLRVSYVLLLLAFRPMSPRGYEEMLHTGRDPLLFLTRNGLPLNLLMIRFVAFPVVALLWPGAELADSPNQGTSRLSPSIYVMSNMKKALVQLQPTKIVDFIKVERCEGGLGT